MPELLELVLSRLASDGGLLERPVSDDDEAPPMVAEPLIEPLAEAGPMSLLPVPVPVELLGPPMPPVDAPGVEDELLLAVEPLGDVGEPGALLVADDELVSPDDVPGLVGYIDVFSSFLLHAPTDTAMRPETRTAETAFKRLRCIVNLLIRLAKEDKPALAGSKGHVVRSLAWLL